jgi:predicted ATP-grasp superfamily ATP-dependent carboligase
LAEFARSSEYETRSEVLTVAETLPDHEVLAALEILAKDTDAELAEEASAELLALRERLSVERDFPVSA